MHKFGVYKATTLAQRNEFQLLQEYYYELAENYFVQKDFAHNPQMRGYALSSILSPGDIAVTHTAYWLYTGKISPPLKQKYYIARQDARHKAAGIRRRFQSQDLQIIGGQQITSLERTALDLLLLDLETGMDYLWELLPVGTSIKQIYTYSKNRKGLNNMQIINQVLAQLANKY